MTKFFSALIRGDGPFGEDKRSNQVKTVLHFSKMLFEKTPKSKSKHIKFSKDVGNHCTLPTGEGGGKRGEGKNQIKALYSIIH